MTLTTEDHYDGAPPDYLPPTHRQRRWPRVLLGLLATLLLLGGVVGMWFQRQIDPSGPAGPEVQVTFKPGTSTQAIAAILDDQGVITSARLFRYYVRVKGEGPFEAGAYTFHQRDSFKDVIKTLNKGAEITYSRLTIPEGFTMKQIAERVGKLKGRSAAKFLEVAASGAVTSRYLPPGSTNLEGLLFPDTYILDTKDDEQAILQRMASTFEQKAAQAGFDDAAAKVGLQPYQAAIVASLIESEGKVATDRPKISRVIYNRLAKKMRLQIDATVIYARGGQRRENGRVLFSDLEVDSPYNTYKVTGLPPTPISAPGLTALRAAVAPEPGPWLYYVKYETDGTHAFATTLAEFNRYRAEAKSKGVNP